MEPQTHNLIFVSFMAINKAYNENPLKKKIVTRYVFLVFLYYL